MGSRHHQLCNKVPIYGDKVPYSAAALFTGDLQSPGESGGFLLGVTYIRDH